MMKLSAPQVYQFPEMEGPFSAMAMLVRELWEFRFTQRQPVEEGKGDERRTG